MPKVKNNATDGLRALKVKLEYLNPRTYPATLQDFENIVECGASYVLGQTHPTYEIQGFDSTTSIGIIIIEASKLHPFWAALSLYGMHYKEPIALHVLSVNSK